MPPPRAPMRCCGRASSSPRDRNCDHHPVRGFSEQEQDGPFRVLTRILRRFVFLFRCIGGSLRAACAELSGSARQRINEAAGGDRGGSIATYVKGAHKETGPMGGTESVVQALTGTEFASRESIIYAAAQIPQGGVLLLHLSSARRSAAATPAGRSAGGGADTAGSRAPPHRGRSGGTGRPLLPSQILRRISSTSEHSCD
mmetsp:Transcript_2279/g.4884  ORF Transcript_2279/g.4884 Transcript_2279/m.4884 type:complete len:200 (-) Transcript_2279:68-667(-)